MVEGILRHPQVVEAKLLSALGNPAHRSGIDWVRRPVWQREAEGNRIFEGHGALDNSTSSCSSFRGRNFCQISSDITFSSVM